MALLWLHVAAGEKSLQVVSLVSDRFEQARDSKLSCQGVAEGQHGPLRSLQELDDAARELATMRIAKNPDWIRHLHDRDGDDLTAEFNSNIEDELMRSPMMGRDPDTQRVMPILASFISGSGSQLLPTGHSGPRPSTSGGRRRASATQHKPRIPLRPAG